MTRCGFGERGYCKKLEKSWRIGRSIGWHPTAHGLTGWTGESMSSSLVALGSVTSANCR